jgi:hypothetical protein
MEDPPPDEHPDGPEEEEDASDSEGLEVKALLGQWAAQGGTGKRKRRAGGHRAAGGKESTVHAGFLHTVRARAQHVSNLVACMRHFASTKDDARLAHVLAALLQAEVRRPPAAPRRVRAIRPHIHASAS